MSEYSEPEDSIEEEMATFGLLARSIAPENLALDQPPEDLWARIHVAALASGSKQSRFKVNNVALSVIGIAAAIILVIGGGFVFLRNRGNENIIREVALSNEGLDPSGAESLGKAKLVELERGRYGIKLDLSSLPEPENGYLELWTIDPQVKTMVSLGPLEGEGIYRLPRGVNPESFPIIDISIEPPDGVPTHSGISILRGRLV